MLLFERSGLHRVCKAARRIVAEVSSGHEGFDVVPEGVPRSFGMEDVVSGVNASAFVLLGKAAFA